MISGVIASYQDRASGFGALSLRGILGLAIIAFCAKALVEMALWVDVDQYALTVRWVLAEYGWYMVVAGFGQGGIFAAILLLTLTTQRARVAKLAFLGAATTLWGANVIHNYDVIGLCLGLGSLAPLTFTPAVSQTIAGALIGAALGAQRIDLSGAKN